MCGKKTGAMICTDCGFDPSRDYERHPTLMPVKKIPAVSALRKKWQKGERAEEPQKKRPWQVTELIADDTIDADVGCELHHDTTGAAGESGQATAFAEDDASGVAICQNFTDRTVTEEKPKKKRMLVYITTAIAAVLAIIFFIIPEDQVDQPKPPVYQEDQVGPPKPHEYQEEIAAPHVHSWKDATYQVPKTCELCGTVEGVSLREEWERDLIYNTDTGITAASPGGWVTYALTKDGRVYAIGRNQEGQMDVSHIRDAVAISGGDCHVAVLHADGTVSAIGQGKYGQCDVYGWEDIVSVSAGVYCTVGICEDGTVRLAGQSPKTHFDVSDWRNIIQVDVADHFILGLRSDGTVVATGNLSMAACDVSGWKDIIQVAAGEKHAVGLRADGTVVTAGDSGTGGCNVSGWRDIVSISAGSGVTVGLCLDGTVLVAGDFTDRDIISSWRGNQNTPMSWHDIIQIECTYNQIVGLSKNGYIYACGFNSHGQCDVEELHEQIF